MTPKSFVSPMDVTGHPFFTIFIPTFNRAHTLNRTLKSIEAQSFKDFDVVIIDDGSTDDTAKLIAQWKDRNQFHIFYHHQPNQGKHVAHNTALKYLRGELTVILDSDDMLVPDALRIFKDHWDLIPESDRFQFAGIEGLCAQMDDRHIAGTRFPEDVFDSDYFEIRDKYKVGGDKKNAVRTDLLQKFPFPQFPDEKHIRPSLLWKKLSMDHKFRYINEVVQLIEYQPDGLSSDRFSLRINNPFGFRMYFMEETNLHGHRYRLGSRLRNSTRYVSYSFHSGIGLKKQVADINHPILWLLSIPGGYMIWLRDKIRMSRRDIGKSAGFT